MRLDQYYWAPGYYLGFRGLRLREKPHVSDDETVANMGHPIFACLFFFEDEVGGGGAGSEFDPVRDACGDVGDVSGVEDYFFSALKFGAEGFAGAGAVGVLSLHGAAGDEGDGAFVDDHLIGPELMTLGSAGVNAHDEEGMVGAEFVEGFAGQAGWTCLRGGRQFGFALLEVGGGVNGGVGGLGDEGHCHECDGKEDARKHSGSFGWTANCNG
jgi:hypothetical protein